MTTDHLTISTNYNNSTIETSLHIVLTTDQDDDRPVYLAGNFNSWHTQDSAFLMEKIGSGMYHFAFPENFNYPETLLYKFTKGDWSEVEIDQNENITGNRASTKHVGLQKEHVSKWRRNWLPFKPNFLPKIVVLFISS